MTLSTVSRGSTAAAHWTKSAAGTRPLSSRSQTVVTATARPIDVGSSAADDSSAASEASSGRTDANVRSSSLSSSRSAGAPRSGSGVSGPSTSSSMAARRTSPVSARS